LFRSHDNLLGHADLGRRETYPVGVVHGLHHILDELLHPLGHPLHGLGLPAQHLRGHLDDGQHGHGASLPFPAGGELAAQSIDTGSTSTETTASRPSNVRSHLSRAAAVTWRGQSPSPFTKTCQRQRPSSRCSGAGAGPDTDTAGTLPAHSRTASATVCAGRGSASGHEMTIRTSEANGG